MSRLHSDIGVVESAYLQTDHRQKEMNLAAAAAAAAAAAVAVAAEVGPETLVAGVPEAFERPVAAAAVGIEQLVVVVAVAAAVTHSAALGIGYETLNQEATTWKRKKVEEAGLGL
jgi:hypothetical protein